MRKPSFIVYVLVTATTENNSGDNDYPNYFVVKKIT